MNEEEHVRHALVARTDQMVRELAELVELESPTGDVERCARCAEHVVALAGRLGLPARVAERGDRPHVLVGGLGKGEEDGWDDAPAPGQLLLLAYLDTVWPAGTAADWPFAVRDGLATGPGAYDMKAGIVQGLHALSELRSRHPESRAAMLVTSDEEVGSQASQPLVEELARRADAVLVLEPGLAGGVKLARKGFATWRLGVIGRASHAGLAPELGVNAAVELARLVLAADRLGDPVRGTTVVVTTLGGGTAANVVPERAVATIDCRSWEGEEIERVQHVLEGLAPVDPAARVELVLVSARPALPERAGAALLERARAAARALGLGGHEGERVGGVSDGNLAAAVGAPVLDGLGAAGAGAHARDEHVVVEEMALRAALLTALLTDLAESPARATKRVGP